MFKNKIIKTTAFLAVFAAAGSLLAETYKIDVEVHASDDLKKKCNLQNPCALWYHITDLPAAFLLWSRWRKDNVTISTDNEKITTGGVDLSYSMNENKASCGETLAYKKDGQTLKSLKVSLDYNNESHMGTCSVSDVVYQQD